MVPLPLGEPDPVAAAPDRRRDRRAQAQGPTPGGQRESAVRRSCSAPSYRFAHQRITNLPVTNVPGPPVPLYLAGARLLELFPVVSILANFTLDVGVLSYAGQLNLTAVADRDSCPDVDVFAQGVRGTLDDLARSVLVATSQGRLTERSRS